MYKYMRGAELTRRLPHRDVEGGAEIILHRTHAWAAIELYRAMAPPI